MDKKYTPEGLPILTKKTIDAYTADLNKSANDGNFIIKEWLDEISDEAILVYIIQAANQYPPEMKMSALAHLTGLYKLLQSQGNNYKIDQYWGFDDSEKD